MLDVKCRKNVVKNVEFENNTEIRMRLGSWGNR